MRATRRSDAATASIHAGPLTSSAGRLAASAWLNERHLPTPVSRWNVEIRMDVRLAPAPSSFDENVDSRFHIDIYSDEWGFFFCHGGRQSWIRVTDTAFAHLRDDHFLLPQTPSLKNIGTLLRSVEGAHRIWFRREHALVRTNLPKAETSIRAWVTSL